MVTADTTPCACCGRPRWIEKDPIAAPGVTDLPPVDPRRMVHFLAAREVAGMSFTHLGPTELRDLIDRVSRLSIPDAVQLMRREGRAG